MTKETVFNTFLFICISLISSSCSTSRITSEETKTMVSKINTQIDPDYLYQYEKTKFVPPDGKTLLIMGQDKKTIAEYRDTFNDQPSPSGWTAYWGVTGMSGVDRDSTDEVGRQFGYQNHQTIVDASSNSVLQSGLWIVGMWEVLDRASKGEFNSVIRDFSRWAKTINRPLYLRIGYEFDGKHNEMEPDTYVKAYKNIVDTIRAEGVDNIAFVWQSYAAPTYKGYPIANWYPGDNYVDWVGISLFGHMYSKDSGKEANTIFEFAKHHKKPVMIAESSPINGIDKESTEVWDTWFVNYFSLTYQKNIKAISFINANWTSYPGFSSLNWKDARLQNNPIIADAWFKEIEKERYLKQSPDLFKQLGYSQ